MSVCIYWCLFELITNIIYPLKQTYQAYKLQEKLQIWVVYWIIMSSIYLLEEISFGVLLMIPGYSLLKTIYAVWLYYDKTQGALLIGTLLKPHFHQIQNIIVPFQEKLEFFEKIQ